MSRKQRTRIISTLFLVVILSVSGFLWKVKQPNSAVQERLVIGAQLPLSSVNSSIGEAMKKGAEMKLAEEQTHFAKLGYNIELLVKDDGANIQQGEQNAYAFVEDEAVKTVIGHYNAGVALATASIYEQAQLASLSPAVLAPSYTTDYAYTNRLMATDEAQALQAATFIVNELHADSIFIVHDGTTFGQEMADQIRWTIQHEVEIIGLQQLSTSNKETIAEQLVDKAPDVVYFSGHYEDASSLIEQLSAAHMKAPFITTDSLHSASFTVNEPTMPIYFASSFTPKGIQSEATIDAFTQCGYDMMTVTLQAVEQAIKASSTAVTRADIAQAMHNKPVNGQVLNVTFNKQGDNTAAQTYIYEYNGQQLQAVEKQ